MTTFFGLSDIRPSSHEPPAPRRFSLFRVVIGYSLIALFALLTGVSLSPVPFVLPDISIFAAVTILTLFFAFCYAVANPHQHSAANAPAPGWLDYATPIALLAALSAVLSVIVFVLIYYQYANTFPPRAVVVAVILHVLLCCCYGIFLVMQRNQRGKLVRHVVLWPPITLVAANLSLGMQFGPLKTSLWPLLPPTLLILFLAISELWKFSKRILVAWSIAIPAGLTLATFLPFAAQSGIGTTLRSTWLAFLFALTTAAYLANFESWPLAAYKAQGDALARDTRIPEGAPTSSSAGYFAASLIALVSAMWAMPVVYVLGDLPFWFVIAFALHSVWSLRIWYTRTETFAQLTGAHWASTRTWHAALFVLLLVLTPLSTHLAPTGSIPLAVVGVFLAFLALTLTLMFNLQAPRMRGNVLWAAWTTDVPGFRALLTGDKTNALRVLSQAAWVTAFALFLLQFLFLHIDNSPIRLRMLVGCAVYLFYVLMVISVEWIGDHLPPWRLGSVFAILLSLSGLLRFPTALLIVIAVGAPGMAGGAAPYDAVAAGLPMALLAMGGCALNDYRDAERDRINKPYRALPSGRLGPTLVLWLAIACLAVGSAGAVAVSLGANDLAVYGVALIGVLFYNTVVERFGYVKWALAAILSVLPVVLAVIRFNLDSSRLLVVPAAFLFVAGREIIMDVLDVPGDRASGVATLPMQIGRNKAQQFAEVLLFCGTACLVALSYASGHWVSWMLTAGIAVFTATCCSLWTLQGSHKRWIVYALWLPMLASIRFLLP